MIFDPAPIRRRWFDDDHTCIVAATGPSLTTEVVAQCIGHSVIAVSDAWRMLPTADVLYSCDAKWWEMHNGALGFRGERWSSHSLGIDNKEHIAVKYGVRCVAGRPEEGFSLDPCHINYGNNSGFQAINLAILFGARRIILVGFDMHARKGRHFFGDHVGLRNCKDYSLFIPCFERAERLLRAQAPEIQIINATPDSALLCFPKMDLRTALERPAWA